MVCDFVWEIMDNIEYVVGVLHLSSRISYGLVTNGTIKRFTPHFKNNANNKNIYVKTKKEYQPWDMYVIVKMNPNEKYATCEQYIGNIGDPIAEKEYLRIICCNDWSNNKLFKDEIQQIIKMDIINQSIDISNISCYSIDPPGCIDIDDALGISKDNDNNSYTVYIHIADVSSYIQPGSKLDKELAKRVESVYLSDLQINMLPNEIVKQCSLTENELKRAYSVIIKFNNDGVITDCDFVKTIIRVTKNMSYDDADQQILNNENNDLVLLYEFANKFASKYTSIVVNDINIDTHKMVEFYMIIANQLVATKLANDVDISKICLLRSQPQTINTQYIPNNEVNNIDKKLIEYAKNISSNAAVYQIGTENSYHYGLQTQFYTHFTSPIRRYADIIVHRMLSNMINKQDQTTSGINKIVEHMNLKHKRYKRIGRQSYVIDTLINIGDNVITCDGTIVMVDNEKKTVRMLLKLTDNLNIDIEKRPISKSLDAICEYKQTDKGFIVIYNNDEIPFELFQQIKVKLAIVLTSTRKITIQFIEPSIALIMMNNNNEKNTENSDDDIDDF